MQKKNIIITGLGGTIGRGLIESLPPEVEVFHLGTRSISHPRVNFFKADFTEDPGSWKLPEQDFHGIIHLSQSPEFRNFPQKALNVFRVNTYSTLFLADLAVKWGIKNFLYASSGGVYPFSENSLSEVDELRFWKAGFYQGTKLASEILVDSYKDLLNLKVARFFFAYGPHQPPGMLIPRLIGNVKAGQPLTLVGEEGLVINPIYYTDAAAALWPILDAEESFDINVGGDEVLSLKQIGETIARVCGVEPRFEVKENTSGTPQKLLGSIDKLKEKYYLPKVSFREGVSHMIEKAQWNAA